MAEWDISSAVSSLRSLLGDGPTDKFEFKADVTPPPDGVTKRFFVGQTRVVPASVEVYVDGAAPSGTVTPNHTNGTIDLEIAPSGVSTVQASYYYEWFTDPELQGFLDEAARLIGYTGLGDGEITTGLRPVLMEFATYYAFMRKATETANAYITSAAGYTADTGKSGPNWKALAEMAWKNANEKLKLYVDNPLTGAAKPAMRFISFKLPNYTPGS